MRKLITLIVRKLYKKFSIIDNLTNEYKRSEFLSENELKNILLFFNMKQSNYFDEIILKMTSILNQYFHKDGTLPLFNGSNNIYTKKIYDSLNKENYLKKREFENIDNGIAFFLIKIR